MRKLLNKKTYALIALIAVVVVALLLNKSVSPSDTTLPSFLSQEDAVTVKKADTSRYAHPDGSFSFAYPDGATVRSIPDEIGETVVVEGGEGEGIQIAIEPFDEDAALTAERIKADIPDMVMNDTQLIRVDGTQAVAFTSSDASFGVSAEVWLVRGGKLYQISLPTAQVGLPTGQAGTPDNSRVLLYNLLTTWRWGN